MRLSKEMTYDNYKDYEEIMKKQALRLYMVPVK